MQVFSKLFELFDPRLAKGWNTKLNYRINKLYQANNMYNAVFQSSNLSLQVSEDSSDKFESLSSFAPYFIYVEFYDNSDSKSSLVLWGKFSSVWEVINCHKMYRVTEKYTK